MKKINTVLRTSIILLVLITCVYIIGRIYKNSNQSFMFSGQTASQNRGDSEVVNIGDVLPTVSDYILSDGGSQKLNDNVKSDYKPLDSVGQLVTDGVSTGQGATQDYNFPKEMYPYRAMLSETQQSVYDQIYENINLLNKEITLCHQLDTQGIKNVMTSIFNDHPELFWLETSYNYGYTSKGTVVSVILEFNKTADNFQTSKTAFLNAASQIINKASGYASDLEKERCVYKALQNSSVYDEDAELNQSAYSALVNGKTVCAGYSRAFQYIMMQLNIPCYFCSGYANGGYHAWNIICVDGTYYNVDISWDDTLGDMTNIISYSYFNLSDQAISTDHARRDMSVNLPRCE
jgi:hypothetical protein